MILTAAAFAALAGTCAPQIDHRDLAAFAKVESRYETWAIGDNDPNAGEPRSYTPATIDEAIGTAKRLLAQGHRLDLGLMQISSNNLNWLGLTIESAFDPCESLRAATMHLQATSAYNTGSPSRGFQNGYVQRLLEARLDPNPAVVSRKVARTATPSVNAAPAEPPRGPEWSVLAAPKLPHRTEKEKSE